jgi:hypothetical protein
MTLTFTDTLTRFYHPIIHLGYGVEFLQPAIIAEALAQAAVHDSWASRFLKPAEEAATKQSSTSTTLVSLLEQARQNETIRASPHYSDGNKVRDGVIARAANEMVSVASQFRVTPDDLQKRTAEMINFALYFAAASQRPDKHVKFDFFYMHCVNCSIFFSSFINQDWISIEDKCRLVEWKGRFDLALYVSRGCPELRLDEIENYKPQKPSDGWAEIIKRVDKFPDDGHASKLIRATANAEQASKPYDGQEGFIIRPDMFLKIAHMAIDSVEGPGSHWARNVGWDEAWKDIPGRPKL